MKSKHENESIRVSQMNELLALIEQRSSDRIIVTGDMNADYDSETIQSISQKLKSVYELRSDSFSTYKIRDKKYLRMIDYIFYKGMEVIGMRELIDQ